MVPDEQRDPSPTGHIGSGESTDVAEESQTDQFETKFFTELTHDVYLDFHACIPVVLYFTVLR